MAAGQTRSFRLKHEAVYASERDCERYDELCRCQDHAGALLEAIRRVAPLSASTRVADIGAGTGKLSRLLAPHVAGVSAVDRSARALAVGEAAVAATAGSGGGGGGSSSSSAADSNIRFHEGDARALPLAGGCVDVAVAGWAISYLKSEHEEWYADGSSGGPWRREVDRALDEMDRILVPGGTAIIIETQGTAVESPSRSGSWLYAHFRAVGFEEVVVRTDYRFPSKQAALDTLLFFFGKGVAGKARKILAAAADGAPCEVPECTGLWWRRKRCEGEGEGGGKRAEDGGAKSLAVGVERGEEGHARKVARMSTAADGGEEEEEADDGGGSPGSSTLPGPGLARSPALATLPGRYAGVRRVDAG